MIKRMVVDVEVVVCFLDLLMKVPQEVNDVDVDGAAAALTGETFVASKARRKGFGDGVLDDVLATLLVLATPTLGELVLVLHSSKLEKNCVRVFVLLEH